MAQVLTFPKEFDRHLFRDLDREFFFIWLVTFIIMMTSTVYMSGRPLKEFSAEDIKRYSEVIYRVKAAPPPEVKAEPEVTGTAEVVEEVEEEPEKVEEEKPVTEVAKKEVREEKRAKRRARQERRREKIREAAKRLAIVGGPTAKGGRRRAGGAAAREALGLSAGGLTGVDAKKMVGMVGSASAAKKVKKLRGGGAISEEVGDIDIAALKALSADDLELMLKEATLTINKKAITARGRGSKAKQRSPSAISGVVLQNKNQVMACYWTFKRRDSTLKGRVQVEFTINSAGEVIRVRFRRSNWGGNQLGGQVERCIKNVISSWRFDPIGEKEGNVTAGATYIFE